MGSTARADRADPEDVRAFLSRYHDRVRSELERFGGTVEKFIGDAVMALFGAPTAFTQLGRREELAAAAARLDTSTPWVEAAQAYIVEDFIGAADIYRRIGSRVDEAHARLRAAAHLDAAGRRSEANVQLQEALAFWRSVEASRYIREGEALLAASA